MLRRPNNKEKEKKKSLPRARKKEYHIHQIDKYFDLNVPKNQISENQAYLLIKLLQVIIISNGFNWILPQ